MKKLVKNTGEIRDKISNAVRLITDPVIQTLGPLGKNVIYEESNGAYSLTNDGVTIARQVTSNDPIENAIIEIIKHGALKTNSIAGDGTTTTTLFTDVLISEGRKLLDNGLNPMRLKELYLELETIILSKLRPIIVSTDEELLSVATISANNDSEVAKHVVDTVKTAGLDGIILIDESKKKETFVEKDEGFVLEDGILSPEYADNGGFIKTMEDCLVFVTDKRLYYADDAKAIIRTALENNVNQLVVVARDFIGKAVETFAYNHMTNDKINILLIKNSNCTEKDSLSQEDLAMYLGGPLISERRGKLEDLTLKDYCVAKKVYSNPSRTVFVTSSETSKELQERIDVLKSEKEKDDENENVAKRLASLTSGMVTLKVGGSTPIEVREKIFRYEDAINATRSAMQFGYLPGGGIGMLQTYEVIDGDLNNVFKRLSEASIRQIAKNAGEHEDYILSRCNAKKNIGYNAKTKEFEDVLDSGIIDPFKVTEMAVINSISIANSILTAGFIIVNDKEEDIKTNK